MRKREREPRSYEFNMWDYGPDNRGPEMAAVSIAMTIVSVVAVALRSYTMAKLLKRFLFEDLLAVVTCVSIRTSRPDTSTLIIHENIMSPPVRH